jgi:hypothetical protein
MNSVSRDQIIEAWTRLCDLDETESDELVKKFMDEQPALGIYLFARTQCHTCSRITTSGKYSSSASRY